MGEALCLRTPEPIDLSRPGLGPPADPTFPATFENQGGFPVGAGCCSPQQCQEREGKEMEPAKAIFPEKLRREDRTRIPGEAVF